MPQRLLLIALLLIGFAGGALAQVPPGNGVGLERSTEVAHERGVVPDTTSPWRYYPIAIGNRWEYYRNWSVFHSTEEIVRDTIIGSTAYFLWRREFRLAPDLRNVREVPVRFDTTNSIVVMRESKDSPEVPFDRFANYFNCPFDSDFGSICVGAENWHVTGGYDVLVAIGGGPTGVKPDTVRTSFKRFTSDTFGAVQVLDFAAGIGFTRWYEDEGGGQQILYYARIDGVEYGESQFPVDTEAGPGSQQDAAAQLEVWPNPASRQVSAVMTLPSSGEVTLSIVDLLGRVIQEQTHSVAAGIPYRTAFDIERLPNGQYLIMMRGAATVSRRITVIQ